MTQICIEKIIQEEFCSIKTLNQGGKKNLQLAYLQVKMLSDHIIFLQSTKIVPKGFSVISLDKKI